MGKKKIFTHATIYSLFFINTIFCVNNGFNWLYGITVVLTAIMATFDIWEVIRRVRK